MSKSKHTKGPWKVKHLDDIFIESENGKGVCFVVNKIQDEMREDLNEQYEDFWKE